MSDPAPTTDVAPPAPAPDPAEVRRAVDDVTDPELPAVTLGMLGVVEDVEVTADGHVAVTLLPTFSGCPATELMARDVVDAVTPVPGVRGVDVRFSIDPPWTPDRIDTTGRARLRSFGIAPPGGPVPGEPVPAGRTPLPLAGPTTSPQVRCCPYCGSRDTTVDSAFGPTPCRDLRYCTDCRQPFEAFRTLGRH